ncbi:hypothetical protein QZH41_016543, partial [Actinostola sp. cb2023]
LPSVVSGDSLGIIDPHEKYFSDEDGKRSGIRWNLTGDAVNMRGIADQFAPYKEVFGGSEDAFQQGSYEGTLFRLPFRQEPSKLSDTIYSTEKIQGLFKSFEKEKNTFISVIKAIYRYLASQDINNVIGELNVQQIHKWVWNGDGFSSPSEVILYVPWFNLQPYLCSLPSETKEFATFFSKCGMKLECNNNLLLNILRRIKERHVELEYNHNTSCHDVKRDLQYSIDILNALKPQNGEPFESGLRENLLVPVNVEDDTSLELVPVDECTYCDREWLKQGHDVIDIDDTDDVKIKFIHRNIPTATAEVLGVPTLMSRILDADELEMGESFGQSESLLDRLKGLLEGYTDGLSVPKELIQNADDAGATEVRFLYDERTNDDAMTHLIDEGMKECQGPALWSYNDAVFTNDDFQNIVKLNAATKEEDTGKIGRFGLGFNSVYNLTDVPSFIFHSFEKYGLGKKIMERCFDKESFFKKVVFPFLNVLEARTRDSLVLYAIDDTSPVLNDLVRDHPCIPASPTGHQLKYPKDLIHPYGKAAQLYKSDDGKFPYGTELCTDERLLKLKKLGMREDDLDWKEVIERARSVTTLGSYGQSVKRTKLLLAFIEDKLKLLLLRNQHVGSEIKAELQRTCFLPILKRPQTFPFKWKGDEYEQTAFLAADSLYPKSLKYLVSASAPILNDGDDGCGQLDWNSRVGKFLEIKKSVSLTAAKLQLETVITTKEATRCTVSNSELKKACEKLYEYFQRLSTDSEKEVKEVKEFLAPLKFVLVDNQFLHASQIAFTSRVHFLPYLCMVPLSYKQKFAELLRVVGVRECFEIQDYINTLRKVREDHGENSINSDLEAQVKVLLDLLVEAMEEVRISSRQVVAQYGDIYLPDSDKIMRSSSEVCIKDCYWMPDEKGIIYASGGIPPVACIALGVKSRRQQSLSRLAIGIPFGQKEKLTNRLKRILTGYPCDGSIMKELLQNADDAKASKICFIKDPRQHPDERVFEDSWKPLQGPALCVYNNAPFTNSDIIGIQNLGEGNKGDDPNKTGQYGIGFNAVYHLTDVPSFISKGDEIGEVMCVFDPNLEYAPCASPENPGVMYKDLEYLRERFTDVLPCFLEQHFPIDSGTMFRFPLRDEKMAETSKISSKPMTTEKLDSLVNNFQEEILEALLFVNNVKEISICEIEDNGNVKTICHVEASMSAEDEQKRHEFSSYAKAIGNQLQSGEMSITQVPLRKVSYVLHLKDSRGLCQDWLIVQQIGWECTEEICQEVEIGKAYQRQDLGLLPRGGVACLISSSSTIKPPGKAYCFLPLPFETGLPIHINGHFALDHEARRDLWKSETGDYRSKWNDILLRQVVAPCYVVMLEEIRQFISLDVAADNRTYLRGGRYEAECFLSYYERFFPSLDLSAPYWKVLAIEVYRHMNSRRSRLLPLLRHICKAGDPPRDEVIIEWLPPTGEGHDKAFFDEQLKFIPFQKVEVTSKNTNLQNDESAITTGLKKTRCIVVEDGKRFVDPRQIVAELMSDDEIHPYLFRVPPILAGYSTLFEKLGATSIVTPAQYAMVLDYIRRECKDSKLDPNETTKAFMATKGLFESINKNSGVTTSDLPSLYLPGVKRNPVDPSTKLVFLRKSTEIFYNDAPHFKERLEGFERLLFVKLEECELRVDNDDSMINQLPESIRPRKLTSFVHETLLENGQSATSSSSTQELRQKLTSNEFCLGLTRLIKHALYKRDMKTKDDFLRNVQKSLSCIHVYSVPGLQTRLVCEGTTIPESEAEVACFEEKKEEGNQEVWKIYVEQKVDLIEYLSRVAEIIDRITGHLLGKALVHLPMMLLSPIDNISSLLDNLKIREDNSTYLGAEATCFPTPGNFIHIEDQHLLVDAFTVFYPGEYVGYELDDPSLRDEDGAATYIYAIIIEEVPSEELPSGEEASPITKRYRINIGKERIVVDAVDLYKFCRRKQGSEGLEIEVFTGSETAEQQEVKPDNLDDAKQLVRKTLEEAWHLPEEKRKKIIKRLFLTWHPDKNPGNEEFCTEVFKFIQAEIMRLETGVDPQRTGNFWSSAAGGYGNFSSYYRRWSGRARDHGTQRSSYYSGGCSSSSYRSNPQPGEATRWYRQAADDLNAASNDVNEYRPSYEWACFKCHQSAEKALKAAQYSRDADKSSTHSLSAIASSLDNSELLSLANSMERLLGDSTRMRYPDRVQYPNIPHDIYTTDMAAQALELAREILNVVKAKFV